MRQNWFKYDGSLFRDISKKIEGELSKNRKKAAAHVKKIMKEKALAIKVTGNLARGAYMKNNKSASFIGLHAPAFHNYFIEFGTSQMRPRPIVYPTFEEESATVKKIMSEPLNV